MSGFIVTVTGETWVESDYVVADKLTRTGSPTISVTGSFADITDWNTVAAESKVFTWFGSLNQITCASHGVVAPVTADDALRAYLITTASDLPLGLSVYTEFSYYVRVVDGNTLTLHTTPLGAVNNSDVVTITDGGSGTHHIGWTKSKVGQPVIYNATTGKFELGWVQRQNVPDAIGATSTVAGARGAVPQPTAADFGKYLGANMKYGSPATGASDLFNVMTFY